MKVLEICAAYKPAYIYGGPTMSVSMLSENLANAGIITEVYATTANGTQELPVKPGEPVNVDGVQVTYFKRVTKDHTHFSPTLLKKLKQEVKTFNLVHIHAWWNLVSVFSCIIAIRRKVPVLLSPRGTLSPYSFQNKNINIKWWIHRLVGKRLLEKCAVHVTSERERKAVLQLFTPRCITVLPNFVKLPIRDSDSEMQRSAQFKLIFFSRIAKKKGLELLIEALPSLEMDFMLTIAGNGDEHYIEELKALAIKNGMEARVNWSGFHNEDKFDLLRAHDLFVLPSYDENFGNTVIESLSVGTPVLISENVGLKDYVQKNNLGWVCKTNQASISATINDIVRNHQAELGKISLTAPGIIYNDFNASNLVKDYIAMYNDIINA